VVAVSFDVFLQRFYGGDAADGDGQAILNLLEPLMTERSSGFARVVTDDGGADIYGLDHPERGVMINHAEGRRIWDLIVELARAGGMVVMPVGCPACGIDPDASSHLPAGAPSFELIGSGADLLRVIETASA
jgi:hypothetical protein